MKNLCRKIIQKILSGEIKDPAELDAEKRAACIALGLDRFIRNSEILSYALPEEKDRILSILQKKPMRTLSGVAVVAAMTHPSKCPHGKCRCCPGGPDEDVPQSYTGKEPAARRAIRYGFDPYLQVTFRLAQLRDIGHPVGKVEFIVMGGTITAQMLDYQEWFVKEALRAMNDFEVNYVKLAEIGEDSFITAHRTSRKPFHYFEDVQQENESSAVRCVGITFETRPDCAGEHQIDSMLDFGVTRVELGVQAPDDAVYDFMQRGHTVDDVCKATALLKDSSFKTAYHLMPGLLGKLPDFDLQVFRRVFEDPAFKPDMIKIYPCLVMAGTEYYDLWKKGEFTPLELEDAVDLIVKLKQSLPEWVRTMRIQRDIPSPLISAGIKSSNLGQIVYREMAKRGVKCRCIRCREVGQRLKEGVTPDAENIELITRTYDASGGKEFFISFEDTVSDTLVGFVRLRFPGSPFRPEISESSALIRELHVYGPMLEIGEKPRFEWQHRGYGRELLAEAERISKECGRDKMVVISGIGVRDYYRKYGYSRDGPYMSKRIV